MLKKQNKSLFRLNTGKRPGNNLFYKKITVLRAKFTASANLAFINTNLYENNEFSLFLPQSRISHLHPHAANFFSACSGHQGIELTNPTQTLKVEVSLNNRDFQQQDQGLTGGKMEIILQPNGGFAAIL